MSNVNSTQAFRNIFTHCFRLRLVSFYQLLLITQLSGKHSEQIQTFLQLRCWPGKKSALTEPRWVQIFSGKLNGVNLLLQPKAHFWEDIFKIKTKCRALWWNGGSFAPCSSKMSTFKMTAVANKKVSRVTLRDHRIKQVYFGGSLYWRNWALRQAVWV